MTPRKPMKIDETPSAARPSPPAEETKLTKREAGKQEKRRRIIAAARQLFREKGFAATTTQEISERAQIASGTLFLYAKTKDELLLMAFVDDLAEIIERAAVEIVDQWPLIDQLSHVFHSLSEYHEQNVDISIHMLREVNLKAHPEIQRITRRIIQLTANRLAAAQADRLILPEIDRQRTAYDFFFLYYGALTWRLSGAFTPAEFRAQLKTSFEAQIRGLSPYRS